MSFDIKDTSDKGNVRDVDADDIFALVSKIDNRYIQGFSKNFEPCMFLLRSLPRNKYMQGSKFFEIPCIAYSIKAINRSRKKH